MRRQFPWTIHITILALLLVCIGVPIGLRLHYEWRIRPAEQGAQAAVSHLPMPRGFTMVAVRDESFKSTEGPCYYGRKSFLVGSTLPTPDALSQYVAALQGQGWILDENSHWEQSRGLIRGAHEYISLSYGGDPGIAWANGRALVYRQAERLYPTRLHGRVDYVLPRLVGC